MNRIIVYRDMEINLALVHFKHGVNETREEKYIEIEKMSGQKIIIQETEPTYQLIEKYLELNRFTGATNVY